MPLNISRRVADLKPSVTVAFMNRAKNMKRQGLDVLAFAAGEPDFDTPSPIKESAIAALRAGQTKYMPTLGDPDTRAAIAKKLTEENHLPKPGEPQQEVILPVPAWVSYAPIAELAGGKVVEVDTTPASGFKMTPEQLRKAINPNSRVLILTSPSNPCGTMYSPDELKALGKVIAETASVAPNLIVLSDEIYEKIAYGGIPHYSIGSDPAIAERVVTLNGLSKAYSMTGWRVGYTGASGAFGKKFTDAMGVLQGQMSTNITSFIYPAIRTALTQCAGEVEQMRLAFAKRAELINKRLADIPGVHNVKATGAFYAFPDVSAHFGKTTPKGTKIASAMDFCEALLTEALVAFVPGEDFGGCGKNHARISFACSEEQINQGCERLAKFVASLR